MHRGSSRVARVAPFELDTRMIAPARLSVVVPTCGRPASLRRLLTALDRQSDPPPFDVIVIVDGQKSGSLDAAVHGEWPFPLGVYEQDAAGPAVARNSGAARARGEILLFLDDDVEPGAATLAAHDRFHSESPWSIGAGDLEPAPVAHGFIGAALRGWWEGMCDRLHNPRHRFTFRDLLTGHCSMPRALFDRLGRFDPELRCHEDFELGYRAIAAGIDLRRVRGADAWHRDDTDLRKILARKFDEGIADVQLVERHPALLRALPLGQSLAAGRMAALVHDEALAGSARGARLARSLGRKMDLFERLSMRDKWRDALERAMDYWYWRGAATGAKGGDAVRALRARVDPPGAEPLHVDVGEGLEPAERHIDRERPAGIRVTLAGEPVCVLDERPGAERLRGVHLRPLLLKGYPVDFAAAAARAGLLPDVLAAALSTERNEQIEPPAGQARVA